MASTPSGWYPASGFYFKVEIAGITDSAENSFKEVSGMQVEQGTEPLKEGGVNEYTLDLPTQTKYSNLVLKRGMMPKSGALAKWVDQSINTDFSKPLTLKNIIVKLLNEKGKPLITWTFQNARPVKYQVADFDSQKSDVLVETMEFTYSFYKRVYAN